jgi:RNA polymerase sigma-70 factor (ECF subfamily)
MTAPIDPELLLRQTGWLRRLALELLGDPQRAEDVLQDTWLAALRRPPEVGGDERRLRAWLARVVRNLSLHTKRGEAHRSAREKRSARPERQPSVEESLRRAALQHELMQAVARLEPAQREVVVLRYLDELPPREIARRLGVSGTAVRSRLARALATLRGRLELEREHDRRAWLAAFLPSASPGAGGVSLSTGGLLMKTQTQLLLAALGLTALGSVVWWASQDGSAPGRPASAAVPPAPALEDPGGPVASVPQPDAAAPAGRRTVAVVAEPAGTSAPPPVLVGRVVDTAARPVAEARVRFGRGGERSGDFGATEETLASTSDAAGVFELTFPGLHGRLFVEEPALVTLLDVRLTSELPDGEPVLVVAARRAYSGFVVDEEGLPLDGVRVAARMDDALLRALRPGVQRSVRRLEWSVRTGEHGEFELTDVGWSEGLRLEVLVGGYEAASELLPDRSTSGIRVVLRRARAGPGAIAGLVVDPVGEPVADALVVLGERTTRTDLQGRFVVERDPGMEDGVLRALHRGFLPAEVPVASLPASGTDESHPLLLRLASESLGTTGRVVDGRGEPVVGAHVWIQAGTRLPESEVVDERYVEDVIGFEDGLLSSRHALSSDGGRFALFGLLAREYVLWTLHPTTLEVVTPGPVEAGATNVTLVLPGGPTRHVAGRVLSFAGDPIPGVRLFLARKGSIDGRSYWSPLLVDAVPTTDGEGRFAFEALCVEGAYLLPASPDTAMSDDIPLDPADDLSDLEIRLPRRCLFQVLLEQDPEEADRVTVLDGEGEVLRLMVETGSSTLISTGGLGLAGGRSEVIVTDERARTLVLEREGVEVRRVPIRLTPDEVQVLRP